MFKLYENLFHHRATYFLYKIILSFGSISASLSKLCSQRYVFFIYIYIFFSFCILINAYVCIVRDVRTLAVFVKMHLPDSAKLLVAAQGTIVKW